MAILPSRDQQIIQTHADLIIHVVKACANKEAMVELEPLLQAAETYGQKELASTIRDIVRGSRELSVINKLEIEEAVVIEAILRGLQDPTTLPDPSANADPTLAAPGLASMINESSKGNAQALHMLATMAEQMMNAGGEMAQLGGIMRKLIDGERDPDMLTAKMDTRGETLVLSILDELAKLDVH